MNTSSSSPSLADALAAFEARKLEQAKYLLSLKPEMKARDPAALILAARILVEQGDHEAAAALAGEATDKGLASSEAHRVRGHALIGNGRPLEAMTSFGIALSLDPADEEVRSYLGVDQARIAYRAWIETQDNRFRDGPVQDFAPAATNLDGLRHCLAARRPLEAARILSIHSWHDATVAISVGGELRLNLELERFSRTKRDYGYREDFLRFCLDRAGLSIDDIDLVCLDRLGGWVDAFVPRPSEMLAPCDRPATGRKVHTPFEAYLLGRWIPALAVNHHVAHAAGAFFTSPFDEAPILVVDGGGDARGTLSWGYGKGSEVFLLGLEQSISYLGQWWEHLTKLNYRMAPLHQLDPGPGPGKVMALAAYGREDRSKIDRLRVSMRFAGQRARASGTGGEFSIHVWQGYPLDDLDLSDTRSPASQDWARALQEATNDELHEYLQFLHAQFPKDALCYSGGVALNCIATSEAMRRGPFKRIHVPPCPNDCGTALGMALYAYHVALGQPRTPSLFSPYTGPVYSTGEIEAAADRFVAHESDFEVEKFSGDEPLKERIADLLAGRQILLMWRGRSECGPRALGHRSVLCRPDIPNVRAVLNRHKAREWYRPFAPIVLKERAEEVLADGVEDAHYMTTSTLIREEWRSRLPGILHVDNSARPQVLSKELEPFLHDVLTRLDRATGIPVILNTSFNLNEPIVETADDALATWWRLGIRHLVLHDRILSRKSAQSGSTSPA